MRVDESLLSQGLLVLAWMVLVGLKLEAPTRPGWVAVGLAGLVGAVGGELGLLATGWRPTSGPSYPGLMVLALGMLTAFLNLRFALGGWPLPPGLRQAWLHKSFRLCFGLIGLLTLTGLLLLGQQPAALQPAVASASLAWLAGSLLTRQTRWMAWRGLGLVSVTPSLAGWLLGLLGVALWWTGHGHGWLLLPWLVRVRPAALPVPETLTPCCATLLLRLPLVTVNRCLELIPPQLLRDWFRPDATRLHLREPLLETHNAAGYLAALAAFLSQQHQLRLDTASQLAAFCIQFPDSAARAVLTLELTGAPAAPPGWECNNLASSPKPGWRVQWTHLLLLQRIARAGRRA